MHVFPAEIQVESKSSEQPPSSDGGGVVPSPPGREHSQPKTAPADVVDILPTITSGSSNRMAKPESNQSMCSNNE